MLAGVESIRWTNPSSELHVTAIPLHLYLNGFSHEDTTWMRSSFISRFGLDELMELYEDPWGWTEPRAIRQDGVELEWAPIAPDDGNPNDRSLIEVQLAEPLAPGEAIGLDVEFEARLPIPMARTGGYADFFFVAQWFPKVAVFETVGVRGATSDGFAAHQFHGQTEFYADYADFDVRIGLPPGWRLTATGKGGPEPGAGGDDVVWHRYRQRAVHDFAFCTGTKMVDVVTTHQPKGSGGPVEIHVFLPEETEHQAPRWTKATEGSLDVLGARVGPFPYETQTVVLPPWWASATTGMEYPTFLAGGPGDVLWDTALAGGLRAGELVIAHEFAHQYFYGLIGTNEFEEAFMDEGLTEYWGNQIIADTYGEPGGMGEVLGRGIDVRAAESFSVHSAEVQPLPVWSGPSYLTRHNTNFAQFYNVPAATMSTASNMFGRDTIDGVFAAYYDRWRFRHPRFEDFLAVAREVGGAAVADFILEAYTQNRLPDYRVARLSTEAWSRARGRLVTEDGVIEPDAEESDAITLAGLDPAAREEDGRITVERIDSGWTRPDARRPATSERYAVAPEPGEADEDWEVEEDTFHLSTTRLEGAGWHHAPVEIVFRFADGAVIRETWDGSAEYRNYRFLRPAPLSEVQIDPQWHIVLDPDRKEQRPVARACRRAVGRLVDVVGCAVPARARGGQPMALIFLEATKPTRGTIRFVGLRWLLWIVAALPGIAAARGVLGDTVANRPYFAAAPDPLPLPKLLALLGELNAAVAALAAGVVVAWLAGLFLTAAAFRILDPRQHSADVRVVRTAFDTGAQYLFPYLRVALLAALAIAVGGRLIGVIFDALSDHGTVSDWSGKTLVLTLPTLRAVLLLGWVSCVGVCAFWCRAILVAERRRYVRRVVALLPRLLWRWPCHGLALHVVLGIVSLAIAAPVLVAWRQSSGGTTGWMLLWLFVLLVQACLWHWRVRAAGLVWADAGLNDLRARPDEPWHLWRKLRARLKRRTPDLEPV